MTIDQYGHQTICDLCYDTDGLGSNRASMKPAYRETLRLRSYGVPGQGDPVFVELKKKHDSMVSKRREQLPLWEAEAFLSGREVGRDSRALREIDRFLGQHRPSPSGFLACDRIALYGNENPGLRIAFDDSIRWRSTALDLTMGDWGMALLPSGHRLMEIQLCGPMPSWLERALGELSIDPVTPLPPF